MIHRLRPCVCALAPVVFLSMVAPLMAAEVALEENIVYGKGGEKDLQLDLARPTQTNGPRPAIVYIHGGGWRGGNRSTYRHDIQEAARRGYVAVTISYRFTDPDDNKKARNPFPAQIEDAKCAVRWLRANAEKYHVDPNRIGVTGGSAGGHLSLLVGVMDPSCGLEGQGGNPNVSSRVQAVVNYFGPTDMTALYATSEGAAPLVKLLLNGDPASQPENYRLASPVTYVTKDDPPVLTIHGADDKLVPPDQATRFDAAMKKAGASHTLLLLEGQGHGFQGDAAKKAREATFEFFDRELKKAG